MKHIRILTLLLALALALLCTAAPPAARRSPRPPRT